MQSLAGNCQDWGGFRRASCIVTGGGIRKVVLQADNRTSNATRLLQLLLAICVCALPLLADTHPVPLDKNTDSAKCLECHAEKGKGKAVHSAVAMGGMSCHEIRVNKDNTRVT